MYFIWTRQSLDEYNKYEPRDHLRKKKSVYRTVWKAAGIKILTRMNFSRMHIARSSTVTRGVSVTETPRTETLFSRDPLDRDPPVDRITDICENITLPQTSFEGGIRETTVRTTTKG